MSSMKQIQICQKMAEIGIQSKPVQINIETNRPKMKIHQQKPTMEVDVETPSFEINWRSVWSESGLKSPGELARSTAEEAKLTAMQYTAKTAKKGDYIQEIQQRGNRIAQLARQKSLRRTKKEINLGAMPRSLPEVAWNAGHIKINWTTHEFEIEWDQEYMPRFSVEPHSVEIYLRNKPYFKITLKDEAALFVEGRNYDKHI